MEKKLENTKRETFQYDVSVIVPVYNVENYLAVCLESLINQDYDFSRIEVIAINDGSTDKSGEVLREYAQKYKNIVAIEQENMGLSKTRNKGLDIANGKYILFLDSDDTLTPESVGNLVRFFDAHYDEVDLVEYKIVRMKNGKPMSLHYRYRYLTKTGIYDLTERENWYAAVTTVNYCIKNKKEDKIYFDTTPGFMHEDQKFSMEIIKDKLKIGYCEEACYLYLQHSQSITKTKFHAYYLFDKTMSFWEAFFAQYNGLVPQYYQALFVNDIDWKFKDSILLPYHLEGDAYKKQLERIGALLSLVDEEVICNHPKVSKYHRQYFVNLRQNCQWKVLATKNSVALLNNDVLLYADSKIDISVHKMKINKKQIYMQAYLRSPVFAFCDKPKLYMIVNDLVGEKKEIPLRESSYSYENSKEKNAQAYLFETVIDITSINRWKFYVEIGEEMIEGNMMFPLLNIFSDTLKRYEYYNKWHCIRYNPNNRYFTVCSKEKSKKAYQKQTRLIRISTFMEYLIKEPKKAIMRTLVKHMPVRKPIWLYYDCVGVVKDNAYFQYCHDIKKQDGIKRYYVSNNTAEFNKKYFGKEAEKFLSFKSLKHKMLYLRSDKLITAFIEPGNCIPFSKKTYTQYLDICSMPEVIYLQHGVLHAHMPWKYSLDRLFLDREVVSTSFEVNNLKENYCFTEEHMIKAGMPRYDFIDKHAEAKNLILYAPSWRSYLLSAGEANEITNKNRFMESEFYQESYAFLTSKELHEMLEKHDYVLNFKLHPILQKYADLYEIDSPRIVLNEMHNDSDYKVFITDFSSYVYDFVYLQRAIVYFIPDYVKFKAGMNLYRELDLKFEDAFGALCQQHQEALEALRMILENQGEAEKIYMDRMKAFFLFDDSSQRERIYESLIAEKEEE